MFGISEPSTVGGGFVFCLMVISKLFLFSPRSLGKWSNLTIAYVSKGVLVPPPTREGVSDIQNRKVMRKTKANQPRPGVLPGSSSDVHNGWWFQNPVRSPVEKDGGRFFPHHIYVRFWRTISRVVVWDFWTIMNHQQYVRKCWHSNWYCRVFWLPKFHRIFFTYAKGRKIQVDYPSWKPETNILHLNSWMVGRRLPFLWGCPIFFQGRGKLLASGSVMDPSSNDRWLATSFLCMPPSV